MNSRLQHFAAILAVLVLSASSLFAQEKARTAAAANQNSLAGSWSVNATPDGGPPFRGLITFSEGGGMIASAQGDNLLNQGSLATPGHGAWTRTKGHEYLFTFVQILYNADGVYDGKIRVRHTANLNKGGDTWSGQLTLEVFDPTDQLVFVGTGSGTATRIVPMPLL